MPYERITKRRRRSYVDAHASKWTLHINADAAGQDRRAIHNRKHQGAREMEGCVVLDSAQGIATGKPENSTNRIRNRKTMSTTFEDCRAERDQLRKDLEFCNRSRIATIHRHGEANALLEKFTRKWIVRVFCPSLRKEALNHVNTR